MSNDEIGKQLFSVLPPSMEQKDFIGTIGDLKALNAYNDTIVVDHDKKICKATNESTTTSSQIDYIKSKLEKYQKLYTDKELKARFTCTDSTSTNGGIEINTYVDIVDTNNCITGSWAGTWYVEILTEKSCNIRGSVHIHVHYYERNSNVQTRSVRTYPQAVISTREEKVNAMVHLFEKEKMSYEEQLSNVIVNEISYREKVLYDDIQTMFSSSNNNSRNSSSNGSDNFDACLRKIRRILPITKTRFKWDTAAQKQVKLLNERSTTG